MGNRMKYGIFIGLMAGSLAAGPVAEAAANTAFPSTPPKWPFVYQQTSSSVSVTSGVQEEETQFSTLSGPLLAHTLQIDLTNPNVKVGAVLANNEVYSKDETVSSMANRTHAVGGINGDFFEIGASGRPENLVMVNGQILQSQLPGGHAVVGITSDGHVTVGPETFTGQAKVTTFVPPGLTNTNQTVTSSTYGQPNPMSATHTLIAVNRPGLEKGGNLVLYTPAMGSTVYVPSDTVAYLTQVNPSQHSYQVVSVKTGVKAIPALSNEVALAAGGGEAAAWVSASLSPGDILTLNESLSPDANIVQAVGSGYQLLKDGHWYADPHALGQSNVNFHNPLTAVGVTRDGKHTFMVVFDGRNTNISLGLTYQQMANYLRQLGAWNAAMLDGGGSSELVARLPGRNSISVMNRPSDGTERRVADGLFVYSTETTPGPTVAISLNQGQPLSMMVGASTTAAVYGVDANSNPTSDPISLSVTPASLANVQGTHITALKAGQGTLVATTQSGTMAQVPLNIVQDPAAIEVSPSVLNTVPGQTTRLSATAVDSSGNPLVVPNHTVRWSVSNAAIGSVSSSGQFAAALPTIVASRRPGSLLGDVTVNVGTSTAQIPVQEGLTYLPLDPMTHLPGWLLSSQANGKIFFNRHQDALPRDKGSMEVHYDYPKGNGSEQVVFWPKQTLTIGSDAVGDAPSGLGLWMKGNHSGINFAISITSESGNRITLYPTSVNFSGWHYVTIPFPAGLGPHVTINYLDFLTGSPTHELTGNLFVSHLEALYPNPTSIGLPNSASLGLTSPNWFQPAVTPAQFGSDGTTLIATDGALWVAAGNLNNNGLQGAKKIPVFSSSHTCAEQIGTTKVIVLNDNQGAYTGDLSASDTSQSDSTAQFSWLLKTLAASKAKTVVIATAQAPYSPVPGDKAAFIRQPDATALEQIALTYEETHPNVHVLFLVGSPSVNSASPAANTGEASLGSARFITPSGTDVLNGGVYNLATPSLWSFGEKSVNREGSLLLHVAEDGSVSWIGIPISQVGSAGGGGVPPRVR